MSDKRNLRRLYKKIRVCIDDGRRAAEEDEIFDMLINSDEYKSASSIFVYVSFGSEVSTIRFIKKALCDAKIVTVPLCDTKSHTMRLIRIDDISRLEAGAYGISEPKRTLAESGELKELQSDEIDVAIVPGLAFDGFGARLGYGGGYYDRFLAGFKGRSIGLAYTECMAESLPTDKFDCKVDKVIHPGR